MEFISCILPVPKNSKYYLLFGLCCIALGLSLSKPAISLGYIFVAFAWFLDGNIIDKIKAFLNNRIAIVISMIYFISVWGIFYSNNLDYGLNDLRKKAFLFILPFLLSGFNALSNKEFHFVLKTYIIGVFGATLWSLAIYLNLTEIAVFDSREYSRFNSHIRFGLEIAIAGFFSFYYAYRSKNNMKRFMWLLLVVWLVFSPLMFKFLTGTLAIAVTALVVLVVKGVSGKSKALKYITMFMLVMSVLTTYLFVTNSIEEYYSCSTVEPIEEIEFTKHGESYSNNEYTKSSTFKENGYYVERNVAWTELRTSWNKRSQLDFNGPDKKGNALQHTLMRYITSKGLRKDQEAVESLSQEEIFAIENGVSNYKYLKMNFLKTRAHKIIFEFDNYLNGGDFNGHSVVMRVEYWKIALQIVAENPVFGIGTGDVQDAFKGQYEKNNSILREKFRRRSHNQFLAYGVSSGIVGILVFLFALVYPVLKTRMYQNYLYLSFFVIITLSMLTEDTLETQVGINLFVFFNSLFLIEKSKTQAKDLAKNE